MTITPTQLWGVAPNINAGTLSVDLSASGIESDTMPSTASLLAFLTLNAQANQGVEPGRPIEIVQAVPVVLTRNNELQTRYRFTVDFYGDDIILDPATL